MQPIGKHITIIPIENIAVDKLIVEKEALSIARVIEVSPDIDVPFEKGSLIKYIGGKQIEDHGELRINIDHILLWK